jgi:hypothetical protein
LQRFPVATIYSFPRPRKFRPRKFRPRKFRPPKFRLLKVKWQIRRHIASNCQSPSLHLRNCER